MERIFDAEREREREREAQPEQSKEAGPTEEEDDIGSQFRTSLCPRYAMSGTHVAYGAMPSSLDVVRTDAAYGAMTISRHTHSTDAALTTSLHTSSTDT
eukprot:2838199-Rhodomonas_salina.1